MAQPITIDSNTPGLRLDAGIRERGEEMYLSGPNPEKPKVSGRGKSTLESALNYVSTLATDPITALVRQGQSIFQHERIRGDKIRELAGSQSVLDSFDKDSNTYGALDWITRNVYNIKPDDITSQRIRDRERDIKNTDDFQALETEFRNDPGLKNLFPKGSLTSLADIRAAGSELQTRNDLLEQINNQTQGPGLLATARAEAGGRRLTNQELRQLNATATTTDPIYIEDRQAAQDASNLIDQKIKASNADIELTRTRDANNNALANAKIDHANKTLEYEFKNSEADRDYNWRTSEADRDLKKTLTMLGLDDKAAEREMRYDERQEQNRQLMILQLLKGLQQAGSIFGG